MSKFRKQAYITVDYQELEEIIAKHFQRPGFSIFRTLTCCGHWRNDTYMILEIGDAVWKEDAQDVVDFSAGRACGEEFLHGKWVTHDWEGPHITTLLEALASINVIESGDYLVHVCW